MTRLSSREQQLIVDALATLYEERVSVGQGTLAEKAAALADVNQLRTKILRAKAVHVEG